MGSHMLYFDHFKISLNEQVFEELKGFFSQFSNVGIYKVLTPESSWEGIYPFAKLGAYPEFIKANHFEKENNIEIALSNTRVSFLHERLKAAYPDIAFKKDVKVKGDGSEYYISSKPESTNQGLIVSALDWQGAYKNVRENVWGKDGANPFSKIESLEIKLTLENFEHLKENSTWISSNDQVEDKLIVAQYDEGFCPLRIIKSSDGQQGLRFCMKVSNLHIFPKNLPSCLSLDKENSLLSFSYNMDK